MMCIDQRRWRDDDDQAPPEDRAGAGGVLHSGGRSGHHSWASRDPGGGVQGSRRSAPCADRQPSRKCRRAGLRVRLHAAARSGPGNGELPPQEAARRRAARTGAAWHLGLLLAQARRAGQTLNRLRGQGGRAMTNDTELREDVRRRYAEAATAVTTGSGVACDCCHPGSTCAEEGHAFGPEIYEALADERLPEAAILASLGCGNPTAVADLHLGEPVLDLGP